MTMDEIEGLIDSTPLDSVADIRGETLTYRDFAPREAHDKKLCLVVFPGYAGRGDYLGAEFSFHLPDHRVIGINPRGFGESTLVNEVFDHRENAIDAKILLDRIGVTRTMVIGFSTGGPMAAYMALMYSELVTACFLYSSIPLDGARYPALDQLSLKPVQPAKYSSSHRELALNVRLTDEMGAHSKDEAQCRAVWATLVGGDDWLPPLGSPAMKRFHQGCLQHRCRVASKVGNASFNVTPIKTPVSEPSDSLSKLQVPIIVLHGRADRIVSFEQTRLVTSLAIEENWDCAGLLSFYEHGLNHFSMNHDPHIFMAVYRQALEEQVIEKEKNH